MYTYYFSQKFIKKETFFNSVVVVHLLQCVNVSSFKTFFNNYIAKCNVPKM